jgi:hypothetical protein
MEAALAGRNPGPAVPAARATPELRDRETRSLPSGLLDYGTLAAWAAAT